MKFYRNKAIVVVFVAVLLGLLIGYYIFTRPINASVINYLPYIFGIVFFLGGLYALLISFRIYKPNYKNEEQQSRFDESLEKSGKLWKVCSIIMFVYGAYNLIWHDTDLYRLNSQVEDNVWTNKDKATLIKMCMRDAGATAEKYPQITSDYCTCSINKVMQSIGRKEYIENLSKSVDEQYKIDSPFIKGCVIIFSSRIDSAKKQKINTPINYSAYRHLQPMVGVFTAPSIQPIVRPSAYCRCSAYGQCFHRTIRIHIFNTMQQGIEFFTATCLNWQPLLQPDRRKQIIMDSLNFLVNENRI